MRPDPLAFLSVELDAIRQQGLYRSLRVLDDRQQANAHVDGRAVVNLSSNNYLGLTTRIPRWPPAQFRRFRTTASGRGRCGPSPAR